MTRPGQGKQVYKKLGRDTVERYLSAREKECIREQKPEAALWCATVRRAWSDAFYPISPTSSAGSKGARGIIKRDALLFLTGGNDNGRDRQFCCDHCDISEEWIRKEALKAIENGPPQPAPAHIYCDLDDDRSMRTTNTNWCRIRQMEKKAKKSGNECMSEIREGM
jgi:hypothetical protein